MTEPTDFIGKQVQGDIDSSDVKIINNDSDEKVVYASRVEPEDYSDGYDFHLAGAAAYEIYVICSTKGVIEEMNQRAEPCGCGDSAIAPSGMPAHLFQQGSLFDVSRDDVAEPAQQRILDLLSQITRDRTE